MSYIKAVAQNLACVLVAGVFSYYFSSVIGAAYCGVVENCSAGLSSVDFSAVVGLLIGYFLFVPLWLITFGSSGKSWWIAVLTLPILAWAIYADIRLIQLAPMVLSIVAGIILGTIANKALTKLAPVFMAKIS